MALSQTHYHFGENSGTEATYPRLAADGFPVMLPPGREFLTRIGLQNNAVAANNAVMQWQYQHERAGVVLTDWTNVTTTSAVVRTGATAVFANGANCTKRLGGTGTFEASGAGCTHDGSAGGAANDVAANGCTETLIGLQIINANTAVGDIIRLRIANMAAYTVVPEIRVGANVLAIASQDASEHWTTPASVTRIANAEVAVKGVGMSAADLADSTLSITMNVWGTTVPGSVDPADFTIPLYGPDVWSGGAVGKAGTELAGMAIPPGFVFGGTLDTGIRRVRASFAPSRTCTFGVDATIIEVPA